MPLHCAAAGPQADAGEVTRLLSADPSAAARQDGLGMTPLAWACWHGRAARARSLLARGASHLARDSRDRTPMHCAAAQRHLACLQAILACGALAPGDVNAVTRPGWVTALHLAAMQGDADCCAALLAAGARANMLTADGASPYSIALQAHGGRGELLRMLAALPPLAQGLGCGACGRVEGQDGARLFVCTGCASARYCSAYCQRGAWRAHKGECMRLRAAREGPPQ
jgi:ankyrin repeat protein